ncbi:MAG TPA: galactokinase [bacterium]|mgnify:CR=1 FL=1|nr:galactokinase [bacterium]
MIITQTPFRITLGGGGTDLLSYYRRFGGFLISAAIDKYVYITVNRRSIDRAIWLSYSQIEKVEKVDDIKHELIREALRARWIDRSIEIHSITELSSGTGLGSSGSFLVGLLNALSNFRHAPQTKAALAEEACTLEIETLQRAVGKQDQYIAAFGGIVCLEIDPDGEVTVTPLKVSRETVGELETNVMMFYTGVQRSASAILSTQKQKLEQDDARVTEAMHAIKAIGLRTRTALEAGDTNAFGDMLHEHWELKKQLSPDISLTAVDELYAACRQAGARGGKLIGAGGGGFFMLYADRNQRELRELLRRAGYRELRWRFDWIGTRVIGNYMTY